MPKYFVQYFFLKITSIVTELLLDTMSLPTKENQIILTLLGLSEFPDERCIIPGTAVYCV